MTSAHWWDTNPGQTAAMQAAIASSMTKWVRTPAGWNDGINNGKANCRTTPAGILFHGDSVFAAQNSGDTMSNGFIELARKRLAAKYPMYGDSYAVWTYCAQSNTLFAGPNAPFSSPSGSTTYEAGYGRSLMLAAGQNTTFTPPINGNVIGFEIVYNDYAAGTFPVQVDIASGGATYNVPCTTGNSTPAAAKLRKFVISGLPAGSHTLTINGVAGNVCIPAAVTVLYANGTNGGGMWVARSCNNAGRLVDLVTAPGSTTGAGKVASFPDKLLALEGSAPTNAVSTFDGCPAQAALVVCDLMVNDASLGSAPSAYSSAWQRFYAAVRRGYPQASVLIVAPSYPNSVYSDVALSGSGARYHRYKRIASDFAASKNAAFADVDAAWESIGVRLGVQNAGDLHPNAAGHVAIDAMIGALIAA